MHVLYEKHKGEKLKTHTNKTVQSKFQSILIKLLSSPKHRIKFFFFHIKTCSSQKPVQKKIEQFLLVMNLLHALFEIKILLKIT